MTTGQSEQHLIGTRTPTPIPEKRSPYGPVTTRRLTRAAEAYTIFFVGGLIPSFVDGSAWWKSFGLGLIFPGGGFLFDPGPIAWIGLPITLGVMYLAFTWWFGAGNVLAIPVTWLAAAFVAAALTGSGQTHDSALVAVPVAVVLTVGVQAYRKAVKFRRSVAAVKGFNEQLEHIELPAAPLRGTAPVAVGPELTEDDLAFQRWFLDLGLQPLDRFDGFTFIDQFQFAALRYQINMVQYTLAMSQYARTPAFHGYLSLAQRNLIDKMVQKPVWRYWRVENLWGNLRYDPDPIRRDNIMLSGYLGQMLGMYESVTGDRRYDQPGSLTFRWSDSRSYPYDHTTIVEALVDNFQRSRFGFFPCEPNWIYTGCNQYGMTTLKLYDRMHGTTHFADLEESLLKALEEEFTEADGSTVSIRSSRLGCQVPLPYPFSGLTKPSRKQKGISPPAFNPSLAAIFPHIGERTLALAMAGGSQMRDAIIGGQLQVSSISQFDLGTYKNTGTGVFPFLIPTARELGDDELSRALDQQADASLEPVTINGARHYRAMSPLTMGLTFQGRFSRKDGLFDLVNRGNRPEWDTGPILDGAPYPDVLVARAVTDGRRLDLVLRPGRLEGGRHPLGIRRLVPGSRYWVLGALDGYIEADTEGGAIVTVDLTGRTEIAIFPSP
jgi:hypothetical protein